MEKPGNDRMRPPSRFRSRFGTQDGVSYLIYQFFEKEEQIVFSIQEEIKGLGV